ncbi:MAG: hypothetical protein J1E32_02905 [Treponema sp.]|nr:hypothetical protein [Treponema sp.]
MPVKRPSLYMICQNVGCAFAETCLRHLCFLELTADETALTVLNPLRYPQEGGECAYYNSTKKIRVAWGIRHLLDDIPHQRVKNMRNELIAHFGRTRYYRIYSELLPLLPADQDAVRRIFRKNGITDEPKYGRFTEEIIWG